MSKFLTFLREVRAELAKISWPTQTTVTRLTLLVLGVSLVVGLYIGALDYLFASLLTFWLR